MYTIFFLVFLELFRETLSAGVMPSFLALLWQLWARGHTPVSIKRQKSYLPLFSWHISMVLFHPISFFFCWNSALMGDLSWQPIASMDSCWYLIFFFTINKHPPKTKSKQTKTNYNKKPNKWNQTKKTTPPNTTTTTTTWDLLTHHVTMDSAFGACLLVCMCVITCRPKEACHILSIIPGYNLLTLFQLLWCSVLWDLLCLLLVEVRTSDWIGLLMLLYRRIKCALVKTNLNTQSPHLMLMLIL